MNHYNNKIILIGGSGFLGKNLAIRFNENNNEIIVTSSKNLDLSRQDSILKLKEFNKYKNSTIIFLSAITPDKGKSLNAFNLNIKMAQIFLDSFDDDFSINNHIVYISSDAVYPLTIENINFDTLPSPTDLYSAMHLTREMMFKNKFTNNLTILRPTLIYGYGDTHNSYGPNRFFRQLIEKNEINIFGEGLDIRDHLYIKDLCNLIYLIVKNKILGTINLATGNSISYIDLANIFIKSFSNVSINKISVNNKKSSRYFQMSKFLNELNYSITDLEKNLNEYSKLLKIK